MTIQIDLSSVRLNGSRPVKPVKPDPCIGDNKRSYLAALCIWIDDVETWDQALYIQSKPVKTTPKPRLSDLSITYVIGDTTLVQVFPITETTESWHLHPFMDKTFLIIPSCTIDFIIIGTDVIDCRKILHDVITQSIADISHNYI